MTDSPCGYCEETRSITITKHSLCDTKKLTDSNGIPRTNTPEIVECLFDRVELLMDGIKRYTSYQHCSGIHCLYRIIDSPTLKFDNVNNIAYESTRFYFDKHTHVGLVIDMNDQNTDGYYLIDYLIVSREPNKQQRIKDFLYRYCTATPIHDSDGLLNL